MTRFTVRQSAVAGYAWEIFDAEDNRAVQPRFKAGELLKATKLCASLILNAQLDAEEQEMMETTLIRYGWVEKSKGWWAYQDLGGSYEGNLDFAYRTHLLWESAELSKPYREVVQ